MNDNINSRYRSLEMPMSAIYNNVLPFLTESFAAETESSQAPLQAN